MKFPGWSAEKQRVACVNVEQKQLVWEKKREPVFKSEKRLIKSKIYAIYIHPLLDCRKAKKQEMKVFHWLVSEITHRFHSFTRRDDLTRNNAFEKGANKLKTLRNMAAEDNWNRAGGIYTGETQENKRRPNK